MKEKKFKWNPEIIELFEQLKVDILNYPSLAQFNETQEIRIYS